MSRPEFLKASDFATAKRYVAKDLRGTATSSEVAWLYGHPLIWLRVLSRMILDVKGHIAKSKVELDALKPASGTNADQAYLDRRKEWIAKRTTRIHFQDILENKAEEVKAVIGSDHFSTKITVGDLVSLFMEFIELVEDDEVHVIQVKAEYWVRKLTE